MPPLFISNVPIETFDLAADEDNGTNCLTFGMPKRSEMRDLFEEICTGELPSAQQSLQMEQWGLAPVLHCDQVSCYHGNTTPSDTPFDPTLNRHLVQAANAIVRELGTAARDQYGAASQGLQLINMLNLMEVCGRDGYPLLGWPVHWFANLAMDLNQLNSLILVTVLHIVPHWTPHTADPNSGFAFPWWLYHSEEYAADSQRLQGKGLFFMTWDFFKGLWPLPEVPIADHLNSHIKEQVNYCIKNIQKYADVVNGQG
ncbi:hypothetical protein F5J12DRAFT_898196 [Pisolithus orientalis]|uniref:uncharacterized protein n=1 Tax=Pisolithus orientalis TaxID=936130 RepID=UPI002225548B|nr:uncharacterized protein F5J12DRAFT_898196 [Pisolithus orientalis]KAI5988468.1 hypothetical protein F5J12DRAFT_898196 [Pisolithus orientalis]